jgi:hypothetical protein
MSAPLRLGKHSIGVGDRFAQQAEAQLRACELAAGQGVTVVPVWNKSNREHRMVGSEPASVRAAAEAAIRKQDWPHGWHVDADHIRLDSVDRYLPHCDFFTIDVADAIGKPVEIEKVSQFLDRHPELTSGREIPGVAQAAPATRTDVAATAHQYLAAVGMAGTIYRHIEQAKGADQFIAEVSMDETNQPQTPVELLVILAALADEGVALQTIAPKFPGRFNKGVDYVGDVARLEQEFNDDLCVLQFAIRQYGLPGHLKLSVHSGSDKFSIYAPIRRALRRHNAGLHLKTAGTTWLEEAIGLAEAGGDGLALVKEIYAAALDRMEELCAPYATVIDIDRARLPGPATVAQWTPVEFAAALRHEPECKEFNPHLRQLMHVSFKLAAKLGERYLNLVRQHREGVARNVTHNLFERHIKPVFL